MDATDIVVHFLNFLAPAFGLACFLTLFGRALKRGGPGLSWWTQWGIVFAVGAATLFLALWLTGRDAGMLSYAALVLTCGSTQWLLSRR